MTGDTMISTSDVQLLPSYSLSATPTPLLNLKASFFLMPNHTFFNNSDYNNYTYDYSPSTPGTSPPNSAFYEPANPYRDLDINDEKHFCTLPTRFAPPRYSNRLRSLVSNRPKPLSVHIVIPRRSEKTRLITTNEVTTALTQGSAAWPPTPPSLMNRMDARVWLLITAIGCIGVLVCGSTILASVWGKAVHA
ncbi:hypothetical protein EDC01DRAFT_634003 [Geopyxis carbonaria]|nr:hypothetical protein EDC01DRAFT_634003 [Geopyxis carbonaria]